MDLKKIFILLFITAAGLSGSYFLLKYSYKNNSEVAASIRQTVSHFGLKRHEVTGFLPYWLLDSADKDYENFITTLTYFGLSISKEGSVQEFTKPGESEPGLYALTSGKLDSFITYAKNNHIKLSLLMFCGNDDDIENLINSPKIHSETLIKEVSSTMRQYGFTDLNLDIESTIEASRDAQIKFAEFVKDVKNQLDEKKLGSLTLDISPTDLIKQRLINPSMIQAYTDKIVIMGYDFHYIGSQVTGPVAPVNGAGYDAEFDDETGLKLALKNIPDNKLILGIPLYGYEWETITDNPRSAVMPDSGLVISNRNAEALISSCATCSAKFDPEAKENYVIYKDRMTGTYHQVYYPDEKATEKKIELALKYHISGMALWALGYEGDSILNPLEKYIQVLE